MSVDLSFLPNALRASARVDGWEVSWPVEDAPAAVDALARQRLVILGLDLLGVDDEGQYESMPWSVFEPDPDAGPEINVPAARIAAQEAIAQITSDAPWVLISWE